MSILGIVLGGALGVIQGYEYTSYFALVLRTSRILGFRIFFNRFRQVEPESIAALAFTILGVLIGFALYLLPMTLAGMLMPELRHTLFLPLFCLMFCLGMYLRHRINMKESRPFR